MTTEGMAFDLLVAADEERSNARTIRQAEATPAIPAVLSWVLPAARKPLPTPSVATETPTTLQSG
jgi:hypothetical protein